MSTRPALVVVVNFVGMWMCVPADNITKRKGYQKGDSGPSEGFGSVVIPSAHFVGGAGDAGHTS